MDEQADSGEIARQAPRRVFVSYSRDDKDRARQVIDLLEGAGVDVWWDGLLEGGQNYLPETEAALENADCVVVLWTARSVDSHWVRDEAQSGRERSCLVPVSLDGTQPPLGFRQFQTIDASGWKGEAGAPAAQDILRAVMAPGTAPPKAPGRMPGPGPAVSRRALLIGGAGAAGAAALGLIGWNALRGPGGGSVTMAVMPFKNLSGDAEQVWFSSGLSNELRAILARNPRLRVSAPASSSAGKDGEDEFALAQRLGVANILRGNVQLVEGIARVSVELVQVGDGLLRWADSFDRKFEDVLAVQSEIAQKVALSLMAEIASEDETQEALQQQDEIGGTQSAAAYEAYLRGSALGELSAGVESDRAALAQFDAAIAADPDYASAHAMRSFMLGAIANATSDAGEVRRYYDLAIQAAQRAIEIEPRLAKAHQAIGFALNNGRLDPKAAKPHYDKARELGAGDADVLRSVAVYLAYGQRTAEAQEVIARVLELDPLNPLAYRAAGFVEYFARDFDQVVARMQRALELNPALASAPYMTGVAMYLQGRYPEALDQFAAEVVPLFRQTGQAIAHSKLGDRNAAEAAHAELLGQYGDAGLYQQAQIMAQWGRVAEAIALLERAMTERDPGMLFLPNDPILDPLRGEDSFRRLQNALSS